jgi:hypothetical protein
LVNIASIAGRQTGEIIGGWWPQVGAAFNPKAHGGVDFTACSSAAQSHSTFTCYTLPVKYGLAAPASRRAPHVADDDDTVRSLRPTRRIPAHAVVRCGRGAPLLPFHTFTNIGSVASPARPAVFQQFAALPDQRRAPLYSSVAAYRPTPAATCRAEQPEQRQREFWRGDPVLRQHAELAVTPRA